MDRTRREYEEEKALQERERERELFYTRRNSRRPVYSHQNGGYMIPEARTGANLLRQSRSSGNHGSPTPVIINNRIYNDDEDSDNHDDSYLSAEAFQFNLSRHSKNPLGPESSHGSIAGSDEKDVNTEPKDSNVNGLLGHYNNVLRSLYTGEGSIGGDQKAELAVTPDHSATGISGNTPIFRWIHFEDSIMDFDRFENNVSSIPKLTDAERKGISAVIGRARKFDKPSHFSQLTNVRFMNPSIIHEPVSRGKSLKKTQHGVATWMCLPYFCVQKYSTDMSAFKLRPASHPMKTLLQTRSSSIPPERDMQQQAICHLIDTPKNHCYYIAQIWCVVLDGSLLVTCSKFPLHVMQANSIAILIEPSSPNLKRLSYLCVNRGKSNLWALQLQECQTWFGFVSHFWEFWPRELQFTYKDKLLEEKDWSSVLSLAKKSVIYIELSFRSATFPSRNSPEKIDNLILTEIDEGGHAGVNVVEPISERAARHVEKEKPQPFGDIETTPDNSGPVKATTASTRHVSRPETSAYVRRSQIRASKRHDGFHVFTWMNTKPVAEPSDARALNLDELNPASHEKRSPSTESKLSFNNADMINDLTEIDNFLSREANAKFQFAYNKCPAASRTEVYGMISKARKSLLELPAQYQEARLVYDMQAETLESADALFQFFLPADIETPTAHKYWGGLYRFFKSLPPHEPEDSDNGEMTDPVRKRHENGFRASHVQTVFREMSSNIQPFTKLLAPAQDIDRANFELPAELSTAWLHLIMSAVLAGDESFGSQTTICDDLLDAGMRKVFRDFPQKSLSEGSVFTPFDLISLINLQLLSDIRPPTVERDICDTYWEYLRVLETNVEANPLDRSHQDRITMLKQEISVIKETLSLQRNMFTTDHLGNGRLGASEVMTPRDEVGILNTRSKSRSYRYASNNSAGRSRLSPIEPNGVQSLLVQDSLVLLDKRIRDFKEIEERAIDLETWNIQKIDFNKDRQDSAIFVFTIVTVIFLPLSTVASILGMNTNDIRNMEVNQWVFWTVALPLLAIIVVGCLMWAGELQYVWDAAGGMRKRRGLKKLATYGAGYGQEQESNRRQQYSRPPPYDGW